MGPVLKNLGFGALSIAGVLGCSGGEEKKQIKVQAPIEGAQGKEQSPQWKAEWGEQDESNPVYWWKIRQDTGVKIAERLKSRRELLVQELSQAVEAGKVPPQTLAEAILEFNHEVTSGYMPDYHKMFGGERPRFMPAQVQFQRLPKIHPVEILQ